MGAHRQGGRSARGGRAGRAGALVADPARIARVEPLITTRAVRGPFDYQLSDALAGQVTVGSLLRIPFAGRRVAGVVTALSRNSELPEEKLAEPFSLLRASLPPDLVELAVWLAGEYCSTPARALNLMLPAGATASGGPRRRAVAALTPAGRERLGAGSGLALSAGQRATLTRLSQDGVLAVSALGHDHVRRLAERGLVQTTTETITHRPASVAVGPRAGTPELTGEQSAALAPVLEALSGAGGRYLLHGVTGSGKTEIYLQAVQAALAAGRGAIVLVPEIALTPQSLTRFRERFGEVVAVLHSALSQAERRDEWARLRSGEARVCVGARSAVFAPISDLGLIVVDEEHESSYKHEGDPRYDARAVAQERARSGGAVLLTGSATPRPESFHTLRRLVLAARVDGGALPPVRVLDMRGHHHPLHPETRMALADVRAAAGKAIVLLNRRGWSNFLSCRVCGEVWMCPHCDVALVLHQAAGRVACHHCGHSEPVPARCRACGSGSVARHGAGTEQIEHSLRDALAGEHFEVFRLDGEAARERGRAAEILAAFGAAPSGLLIGTQVVAKGHDFPQVNLGIVLDADSTLRFPDFRAEERTFSLITQLAGRAGRGAEAGGQVLVQTMAPEARSIAYAARHDSRGFLTDELGRRRALSYPPYSSLIRIVCSSVDAGRAQTVADELAAQVEVSGATVLGPAPLFRLRDRHRRQLVIKALERAPAVAAAGAAVDALARGRALRDVSVSVDVDPQ